MDDNDNLKNDNSKKTGVPAPHGEKQIVVELRFWTNDIADVKGNVLPKHAYESGQVFIRRNDTHGIGVLDKQIHFRSFEDILNSIVDAFIAHGVIILPTKRSRKYRFPKE